MELELHQLELRYEALRKRAPVAERQLLGSLAELGQQLPIVVVTPVSEAAGFVVIDGYKRVRALKRLARDTVARHRLAAAGSRGAAVGAAHALRARRRL